MSAKKLSRCTEPSVLYVSKWDLILAERRRLWDDANAWRVHGDGFHGDICDLLAIAGRSQMEAF